MGSKKQVHVPPSDEDEVIIESITYRGTTIQLLTGDITSTIAYSIVTPTNEELRGNGGPIDRTVHSVAGFALLEELEKKFRRGFVGRARGTRPHYMDHIRHIIHEVVPDYSQTKTQEERELAAEQLRAAYLSALAVQTRMNHGDSVAFPTMGVDNEFPPALGAQIALTAIRDFIHENRGLRNFDYISLVVPPASASLKAYRVHIANIFKENESDVQTITSPRTEKSDWSTSTPSTPSSAFPNIITKSEQSSTEDEDVE